MAAKQASNLVEDLHRVFDAPPPRQSVQKSAGKIIGAAYNKRRCEVDPAFTPTDTCSHFQRAEAALKRAGIPEHRWAKYIDHLFEMFTRMTRGRVYFAPLNRIAAESLVDEYKATLPPLKLNPGRARQYLNSSGYCGSITAAMECFNAIRKGEQPPPYSEAARSAGKLLAEKASDIGFIEMESDV